MFAKLLCVAAVVVAVYAEDCVPNPSTFYWSTPCDGVTNQFTPTNVQATQNNQSLDSQGGIDATVDLVVQVTIDNTYGKTITTPLVDMSLQDYSAIVSKCKWSDVPTFGVLDNMDLCQFVPNCHFDSPPNPTQFTFTANIAQLAGSFVGILKVGTYYGISITFKDGKDNKLACAYIQDKVIKI